jgi:DNA-binding MarR family transcriptional regulator
MARAPRSFYLLNQVSSAVRLRLERALREFELTATQYTVMSRVKGREILSSARLARAHHVSPQTMNELIANLVARGLLQRKEDPDNRRVLLVSLTDQGRELLEACDRKVDVLETEFFTSFNTADHGMFRKLLEILIDDIRKSGPD